MLISALCAALAFAPAIHAQEYDAAVKRTVSGRTAQATLGPTETPLPLELSNFLLDHPDLSAFIVNRRKIAPYKIEMLGPRRSSADDGEGTSGTVNLIESTPTHRLYYGVGVHHSRIFPDIHATAVIEMDLAPAAGADGRPKTMTTFRVWVKMNSRFLSGVVKTLRPFLQNTVVRKFSKAFFVAEQVGKLMAVEPDSVLEDATAFPALTEAEKTGLIAMMSELKAQRGK